MERKITEEDLAKLREFLNSPEAANMVKEAQEHSKRVSEYIQKMSVVPIEILHQPMTI